MSAYLNEFFKSGKKIIDDTKVPALKKGKKPIPPMDAAGETDPHRILVKRTIQDKPKKEELVKEFKRFVKIAEDAL